MDSKQHPYIEGFKFSIRGGVGQFEVVNRPLAPAMAAHCCASNIRAVYNMSQEGQHENNLAKKEPNNTVKTLIKKGPKVGRVRFTPVGNEGIDLDPDQGAIYSQHTNISHFYVPLSQNSNEHDPEELRKNFPNLMQLAGLQEAKKRILQDMGARDMVVLLSNPHSFSRLSRGGMGTHHIRSMQEDAVKIKDVPDQQRAHSEFRLPDSSTNPYLSVLMDMASSYYAISLLSQIDKDNRKTGYAQLKATSAKYESNKNQSLLKGTPLYPDERFTGQAENAYKTMFSSFVHNSLLLPVMQQVMPKGDENRQELDTFRTGILEIAQKNMHDRQNPDVGKPEHYFTPR